MPIITTDSYRIKAQRYRRRARLWLGVIVLSQIVYALVIWSMAKNLKEVTDATGGIIGFDVFLILSVPGLAFYFANNMANRLSAEGFDLSVQPIDFQPSLRGSDPIKMTIVFQWPKEFDIRKNDSGVPIKPDLPIAPTNLKARFTTDVSAELSRVFERYATELPNPQEVYGYPAATFENEIRKTAEYIAQQSGIPYLKYDCISVVRVVPPAPAEEQAPKPKSKRIIT